MLLRKGVDFNTHLSEDEQWLLFSKYIANELKLCPATKLQIELITKNNIKILSKYVNMNSYP